MLRQLSTASTKAMRLAGVTTSPSRLAARLSSSSFRVTPTAALAASAAPSRARAARPLAASLRQYSSEAEPVKKDTKTEGAAAESKEAGEAAGEPLSAEEAATLRKELETKTKEVVDWKDKYLRAVADFRNLQERTQREMKAARDFAITQFAKDLVDSVDNLDRALTIVPAEKLAAAEGETAGETAASPEAEVALAVRRDLANLVDGLKMTETVLLQTLKKHGLERFDPVGEKFNPNEHEATFMTPNKDHDHNTVFHTQQKGFRLNGRVLRAAKVGVVNNK
ncbi:mitochondrial co-chaperone [Grosmannia clavigera kw1407]|uniref:GrpE protein homolog n=1 Tax=Grosmannia clavigera (strain kw1407 / UAMH 11150) TaxID=655863 RepID=F0XTY7_GROCL|nr:mitochondrial co-chaperone [Grosmannia clavigera kw1407]EFW98676.1 mitochondrial co-chaperone [Grosmannia clavigera kw1407]